MAGEQSPSIIIIDEIDSIGRKRSSGESEIERRIKTEFLKQIDEIDSKIFLFATTNRYYLQY